MDADLGLGPMGGEEGDSACLVHCCVSRVRTVLGAQWCSGNICRINENMVTVFAS